MKKLTMLLLLRLRYLTKAARTCVGLIIGLGFLVSASVSVAASGHTILSATSVKFYVTDAPWADIHYTVNGVNQQNIRMTVSGTNNEYTLNNLTTGSVIRYFFTIGNNTGGATDTPWTEFTLAANNNTGAPVQVFQHCNYGGYAVGLQVGSYTLAQLQALGVNNDDLSSLKVASGYKVTLYQDYNFSGAQLNKTADDTCLVDDNFNDYASSIVVALDSGSSGGPAGYSFCANENQTCNFSGTRQVAYGAGGQFNYLTATNSVACNNASFGDPASGQAKACYYAPNVTVPGTANGSHKRLKIINGCGDPMWVQWLTAPGVNFNGPNRKRLDGLGSYVEYDIPDKGLPSMRFWPGFGCDANGHNCRVGASGGPASLGFTCPPEGCAPPIDSKFEASFGCIPGVNDGDCLQNPSAPGQPLGRGDWWNSSFVDGFTAPMKVVVKGYCPVGPQPAPVYGPGGPEGGVIDCSSIRVSDCPTNENLSSDGRYPNLSNMNLMAINPATGALGGCYSPSAKLTYNQWPSGTPTYIPSDPQAQLYACPTPPISPEQCSSGPADRTQYRNMVHSHCPTYTYPYDDGYGLNSCPAATDLEYEVTFYCPN